MVEIEIFNTGTYAFAIILTNKKKQMTFIYSNPRTETPEQCGKFVES